MRSEYAQLFVFFLGKFLSVGFLGSGGFDGLRLLGALTRIDVAVRIFDVGVLPQLGEIGAEGGLQFLVVKGFLNLGKSILEGRNAGHLMIDNLEDYVSLLSANHVGDFAGLHGKSLVLEFFREFAALERAQVAAISGGGTIRIFLGDILEGGAATNLLEEIVGFGFGGLQGFGVNGLFGRIIGWGLSCRGGVRIGGRRSRGGRSGCSFGRHQNFAQADILRLLHLALVLIIKLLFFFFTYR